MRKTQEWLPTSHPCTPRSFCCRAAPHHPSAPGIQKRDTSNLSLRCSRSDCAIAFTCERHRRSPSRSAGFFNERCCVLCATSTSGSCSGDLPALSRTSLGCLGSVAAVCELRPFRRNHGFVNESKARFATPFRRRPPSLADVAVRRGNGVLGFEGFDHVDDVLSARCSRSRDLTVAMRLSHMFSGSLTPSSLRTS